MASGHVSRIKRPNTWLHRPMLQNVKKALANTEPSTHGTFETCQMDSENVCLSGKIGSPVRTVKVTRMTPCGHSEDVEFDPCGPPQLPSQK